MRTMRTMRTMRHLKLEKFSNLSCKSQTEPERSIPNRRHVLNGPGAFGIKHRRPVLIDHVLDRSSGRRIPGFAAFFTAGRLMEQLLNSFRLKKEEKNSWRIKRTKQGGLGEMF